MGPYPPRAEPSSLHRLVPLGPSRPASHPSPYPPLPLTQTPQSTSEAHFTQPPHASFPESTLPYPRSASAAGGAADLSRDRTLRAAHFYGPAHRSEGYIAPARRPASAAPALGAPPAGTSSRSPGPAPAPRGLYSATRWQSGNAMYPPRPTSVVPFAAAAGSPSPYPPVVASPTSYGPTAPTSPSLLQASNAGSLSPGPDRDGSAQAPVVSSPPIRSPPSPGGAGHRRPSPAELEQEAVERAMQQGIAAEQRRLAVLALEEERLLLLTLEESSSSAALEQLRATALARERALAEERALREAMLSSRTEAEGRVRQERRRRLEEEKAVQRALAQSRRESDENVGRAQVQGKGKDRATPEQREEDGIEEEEVDRREREAIELAVQLSLQEEEKRRFWRQQGLGADSSQSNAIPAASSSAGSPAAAYLEFTRSGSSDNRGIAQSFSYLPLSASSHSLSDDVPPPAYELPQHARELDRPDDVIIGPGRPLPLPPAPAPPSGAAPAQLYRLLSEKRPNPSPPRLDGRANSSSPFRPHVHAAAYPSFAPYARSSSGSLAPERGDSDSARSLAVSSLAGAFSVAATAGSFDELAGGGDEVSGMLLGTNAEVRVDPGPLVEEPEVARFGLSPPMPSSGVSATRADEEDGVDPFDDRFASVETVAGSQELEWDNAEGREPGVPPHKDLFVEAMTRPAKVAADSGSAFHGVENHSAPDRPAFGSTDDEQQRTPTQLVPPRPARIAQPVSAPTTPGVSTYLVPPGASSTARLCSSVSAPTSPASPSYLGSDPSAGGFVENIGAFAPFADEDVLRDVRWGFVDEETSAAGRYPRLEHEGDFPRGAQLSAIETGADRSQAYRAFAVEARTWQGLLVYLMWHGNSRLEAAPYDLEKDKSGRGLQASISVSFYRSGRSSSCAVSVRPPRVRVRLTLLPPPAAGDPDVPVRRAQAARPTFSLVAPAALEPVAPSIRISLAAVPVLPLALSDLATLLSKAHGASRSYLHLARRSVSTAAAGGSGSAIGGGGSGAGGGSSSLGPNAEGRIVLAQAVDLFRRLNGEEVSPVEDDGAGRTEAEEEEVSVLDRLKARLRRRRGPRVIQSGAGKDAREEEGGGALPEGASLITPFSLEP